MAQGAGPDARGLAAHGDDRRHAGVVAGVPICRPHAVAYLVERELPVATRQRVARAVVDGGGRRGPGVIA